MARSTQAQKAERLNAAYRLLTQQRTLAQAAADLSRESGVSLRHAYRYLEQAAHLKQPVEIGEPARPITFKVPGDTIRALRAYASVHSLTLSEVVTRAIQTFVARARRHG
jgi:predicted DNA-binding transcriptional regulator YafY